MPFVEEVVDAARRSSRVDAGAYYGSADGLSPGAGLIFANVAYPIYNPQAAAFEVRRGNVLLLSHECDIDPANQRDFNTEILVAPLLKLDAFATRFDVDDQTRQRGLSLAGSIGAGDVSRMVYLPPHLGDLGPGAFIHFNMIAGTNVDQLERNGAAALCAVSEYGMTMLDRQLQNHLFRAKSEALPKLR